MPDNSDDEWISKYSRVDPKKLHALGVITFNWNSAEIMMRALFMATSRLSIQDVTALTHDLSAHSMQDKLKYFARCRGHAHDAVASILHAVDIFDVNRINRNNLTHFIPSGGRAGFELWSGKGPEFMGRGTIPSELSDLRRVAEEIAALSRYLAEIVNYLGAVDSLRGPQLPLPDKPPLPGRLWKPDAKKN